MRQVTAVAELNGILQSRCHNQKTEEYNVAQKSVTYILLIMCDSHTDEKGNVTHILLVMMAEDEIAQQTKGNITYYKLLIMWY